MSKEIRIDPYAAKDIREAVQRLLRDLGNPEPPLNLDHVRKLQNLDLTYYSKTDINILDEIAHKFMLGKGIIASKARNMLEVINKVGLKALIVPDQRRIFIDNEVVDKKKRFVQAHEISHDLIEWHRTLLLGDNDESLSLMCHQEIEAEANYGARHLLFMGERFQTESRDYDLKWENLQKLSGIYGNSITTTIWQTVHTSDQAFPMFGAIGCHPYYPEIGSRDNGSNIAHFIRSDSFCDRFPNIAPHTIFSAMRSYMKRNKRGPLGEGICIFNDVNGDPYEFRVSSFCNTYDVLTFGRMVRAQPKIIFF